jgi:chromosome segregation ATPase
VRSVDQLTNSLNAARDMIAALQTDLENARKGLVEARTDRDAKLAQVNRLQIQLNSETEARKALEGRLAEAQERMSSLEFENAWFKRRFPGAVASDQPAHTGQILAVEGDRNVVVISLGEEDGVRPGYQYLVSRGGDYVATIQITDVQAKQSAGRALSDISKGEIRRGDRVMSSQ